MELHNIKIFILSATIFDNRPRQVMRSLGFRFVLSKKIIIHHKTGCSQERSELSVSWVLGLAISV